MLKAPALERSCRNCANCAIITAIFPTGFQRVLVDCAMGVWPAAVRPETLLEHRKRYAEIGAGCARYRQGVWGVARAVVGG